MNSKQMQNLERTLGLLPSGGETGGDMNYPEPREPAEFKLKEVESRLAEIDSDVATDYVYGRRMLYSVIDLTSGALAEAFRMASEDTHPRSFEVFNSLANTLRELTKDLMGLQKLTKDITSDKPEFNEQPAGTTVQINQFTSTADMISKFQQEMKENNKTIDEPRNE